MGEQQITSVFLDDRPCADESSFEVHEAIANAIVDEIEHNNPSNIAILGEWGSGKSTILNFVKAKLDDDALLFTFDAWAHSGDALRRNFISSFVHSINSFIEGKHDSDKSKHVIPFSLVGNQTAKSSKDDGAKKHNKAIAILDELEGSTSRTESDEKTSLRPLPTTLLISAGIFAFLELLLNAFNPFINPALNNIWRRLGLNAQTNDIDFSIYYLLISLLLTLVAGIIIYFKLSKHKPHSERLTSCPNANTSEEAASNDNMDKHYQSSLIEDFASFFTKKITGVTTVVKREQSTILDSCKFAQLFRKALQIERETRVIIAFDNLDRLSPREIASTWSTLQIFSDSSIYEMGDNRPWVILPITRNTFIEFENIVKKEPAKSEEIPISLSKLFMRNFEIPAPISTDWKSFFFKQASIAFPDIEEDTCAQVYSIASHSLLRMENRTPRNAKRFLNAMVAISRVFPTISLASIATYCYLRDLYAIEKGESITFNEFIIKVISDQTDNSHYVRSLEQQNPELRNDLAKIAFGQFSSEKASEVFVYAKFNDLVANDGPMDVCEITKGNFGSWEMLHRLVEDELIGSPREDTPSWIFPLLQSLNPKDYDFGSKDEIGRQGIAKALLGRVRHIDVNQLKESGEAIAQYITLCPEKTIEHVLNAMLSTFNTILSQLNSGRAEGCSEETLRMCLCGITPTFEIVYRNPKTKHILGKLPLDSIHFGSYYGLAIDALSEYTLDAAADTWLAERPINSSDEFVSVIERLFEIVNDDSGKTGDANEIRIVKNSHLLASYNPTEDEIEAILELLDIDQDNIADWESAIWILLNLYQVDSPCLESIYGGIDFSQDNYIGYNCNDDAHNLAISHMIVSHESMADDENGTNGIVRQRFNESSIQLARENDIDMLPLLLKKSKESDSAKTAKWMLGKYWSDDDARKRPIEECLQFAKSTNSVLKRKELGKQLALSGRIQDLTSLEFDCRCSTIYFGALEMEERNDDYRSWLITGFESMSANDWTSILRGVCSKYAISLFGLVYDGESKFESLDDAILESIENKEAGLFLDEILCVYLPSRTEINAAITSVFFENDTSWKGVLRQFKLLMSKTCWIDSITLEQRAQAATSIVESKTAYCVEWLEKELAEHKKPKTLLRGHLGNIKKIIEHQLKLSSKSVNPSCKRSLSVILNALR